MIFKSSYNCSVTFPIYSNVKYKRTDDLFTHLTYNQNMCICIYVTIIPQCSFVNSMSGRQ